MGNTPLINSQAKQFALLRKAEKLSQTEMAQLLGTSQSSVQRYEAGDAAIPHKVVKQLHERFKMSYEWFYMNKGKRVADAPKTNLVTDLADQAATIQHLQLRIEKLEEDLRKLYRDFYSERP